MSTVLYANTEHRSTSDVAVFRPWAREPTTPVRMVYVLHAVGGVVVTWGLLVVA